MMKEMYIMPEVEILNVMVEKGFAASGDEDEGDGDFNFEGGPHF